MEAQHGQQLPECPKNQRDYMRREKNFFGQGAVTSISKATHIMLTYKHVPNFDENIIALSKVLTRFNKTFLN